MDLSLHITKSEKEETQRNQGKDNKHENGNQ